MDAYSVDGLVDYRVSSLYLPQVTSLTKVSRTARGLLCSQLTSPTNPLTSLHLLRLVAST